MKLSIITINYNNCSGLQRTIESVLAQTFVDYEWIVVDGGSTDGSRELLEQYKSHFSWWCSEPDKGIYNAMNKGIMHAHGEYLNFLNSGDCYCDFSILETIFGIEKKYKEEILYGNTNYVYPNHVDHRIYPSQINLDYFLQNKTINHQSIFIRLDLQKRYLYEEQHYRISADYAFLMHCQFEGVQFKALNLDVVNYDATGVSQRLVFEAWGEAYTAREREVVSRFLSPAMQLLYKKFSQRRFYQRIFSIVANLLP